MAILDNRLLDLPRGITLGVTSSRTSVRGNLFHRVDKGQVQKGYAVTVGGTNHEVERNTVVASTAWLGLIEDGQRLAASCNVVVQSGGVRGARSGRGVDYNVYYASPRDLAEGTNDVVLAGVASAGGEVCFARRRWTSPQTACVPHAGPTGLDPLRAHCSLAPAAPHLMP